MKGSGKTLRWLSQSAGRYQVHIGLMLLLQALLGGAGVLTALAMRRLVDSAVGRDQPAFLRAAIFLTGLVALQLLARAVVRFLRERCASGLENRLKSRLFHSLLTRDYAAVTARHSGEWMNRLTSDVSLVAGSLTDLIPDLVGMSVRLLAALIAIVALEPRFLAVILPGGLLVLVITYGFRRILKDMHRQVQEADGRVRVFLQERLQSLLVLRSFGREEQSSRQAEEKMAEHRAARMRRANFSNFCNTGFGLVIQGAYVAAALVCGMGILNGSLSYGTMTAILQLVGQIQAPFANLSGLLPRYTAMIASAERLMEVEALPEDCPNPVPEEELRRFYRQELMSFGLEDLHFTYEPLAPEEGQTPPPVVLDGLDLDLQKGRITAFTGPSGSGKSTILKLLLCLYRPDSGRCYLRTRQGRRDLTGDWRALFAYVPQSNQLLMGSVRQILAFGDPEGMARETELRRALWIACADGFVDELEQGMDTVLGEAGAGLSEGQMQRIAIARAIFSDRPILLLDESTSALDGETERRVLENLRAMTDKTVLIVTHRPAALSICDQRVELN